MRIGISKSIAGCLILFVGFLSSCKSEQKAWRGGKIDSLARAFQIHEEMLSINSYEARQRLVLMDSVIKENEKKGPIPQTSEKFAFWQEYKAIQKVYTGYLEQEDTLKAEFDAHLNLLRELSVSSKKMDFQDIQFKSHFDSLTNSFKTLSSKIRQKAKPVLDAEAAFTRMNKQIFITDSLSKQNL